MNDYYRLYGDLWKSVRNKKVDENQSKMEKKWGSKTYRSAIGFAIGFIIGLAIGFVIGFAMGSATGVAIGFALGFVVGFAKSMKIYKK